MRLYIAGAMSVYGEAGNWGFHNFFEAERKLLACGYETWNPAVHGVIEGWLWEDYLRYDLKALLECDGICLLPDWGMSQGAMLEKHVAEKLKMPVHKVEEWVGLHALSLNV